MRTRLLGLSAAVFLCAPAFAQSPQWVERPSYAAKQAQLAKFEAVPAEEVQVVLRVVSVGGKENREAVAKLFDEKGKEPKAAILTEKELLALLEGCAADRGTNILQAPRITTDAAKPATVTLVDSTMYTTAVTVKAVNGKVMYLPTTEAVETGMKFTVSATPSADGKFVELKMSYRDKQARPNTQLLPVTTLVQPEGEVKDAKPVQLTQFVQMPKFDEVKADCTAKVPDCGTVAVKAGTRTVRVKQEFGPQPISSIPYLNCLFTNVGYSEVEQDVIVFATATRSKAAAKVMPVAMRSPAELPQTGDEVSKLVAAYHRACAAGNTDEARRLAVQALAKDPTCFGK